MTLTSVCRWLTASIRLQALERSTTSEVEFGPMFNMLDLILTFSDLGTLTLDALAA